MHSEFEQMFGGGELFVEPRAFRAWLAHAKTKASALSSPEAVRAAVQAYAERPVAAQMVGDMAVIDMCGPITYKSAWISYYFGGAAISDLQQQFRLALNDPGVKTIAFRIDSPGGCIDMASEFADEIFAARGKKPIIAVADTMIASCAYWLASQADTIYATQSAQLGAIGVFVQHEDLSEMLKKAGITITLIAHGENKVDGSPYEPLSDTARADLKANVDEIGGWFDAAVARGRGVDVPTVLKTFGQGKVFRGAKAIKLGLADKAGTFGQVLGKLAKARPAMVARAEVGGKDTFTVTVPLVLEGKAIAEVIVPDVSAAKKADDPADDDMDGCQVCDPACPCEEVECVPDCPTCSPDCACFKAEAAKKAAADAEAEATATAAANDATAILLALSE